MKHILVTGGAGYIGSHMVQRLQALGHRVTVLDDLSGGFANAVGDAELVVASLGDVAALDRLFAAHRFDAVINFASFIQVGESMRDPLKYYLNNVGNTLVLLDAMRRHGVMRYIFSSTAATFGDPQYVPIDEQHPQVPINPYGHSKLMIEQVLDDMDQAYGFKSVCLRYFNAAGADPEAALGERHEPETHLIPLVLQVASGRRAQLSMFGDDYDTPDGTCVRDYVHVADLCEAHVLAMKHLLAGGSSKRYNLGNGEGFSVKQVIEVARQVTGRDITVQVEARRPGDPARLVADSGLVKRELAWAPQFSDLSTIVAHAWAWEQKTAGIVQPGNSFSQR
jgi:UDP-glucose 4-epimerase